MAHKNVNAIIHLEYASVMTNTETKRIEGSVRMERNSIRANVSESVALIDIPPLVNPVPWDGEVRWGSPSAF